MNNREQLIKNYIAMTIRHSREVCDLMLLLRNNRDKLPFKIDSWEMLERAICHDYDKLNEEHITAVIDICHFKPTKTDEEIRKIEEILARHKLEQPHHTPYHIKNNTLISNVNICEMCCDWVSSVKKNAPDIKDDIERARQFYLKKIVEFPILEKEKDKFFVVFDLLEELRR